MIINVLFLISFLSYFQAFEVEVEDNSHLVTFEKEEGHNLKQEGNDNISEFKGKFIIYAYTYNRCGKTLKAVSYTHLTLPTICSV